MSVYLRGKVWYTNFRHRGQRVRRPVGETTKREAERRERAVRLEVEAEYQRGLTAAMRERTWLEAMDRWMREEKPESQMHHAVIVMDHIPGDTPLSRVPDLAMDMRWKMDDDGLAPGTINRRLSIVCRVLNLSFKRWRWIKEPLAQYVEKPTEKNSKRIVRCEWSEFQKMLDAVRLPEVRRAATLTAFTGLRKSELLRLAPGDWQPPFVIVRSSKGGEPREIPLAEALHHLAAPLPFDLKPDQIRYHWDGARERSGLSRIRWHDLRHVFSSWVGDLPDTTQAQHMALMGHADPSQTVRYTHARKAVALVETLYATVTGDAKRPQSAATMH